MHISTIKLLLVAELLKEASNCDALSLCICIEYVCVYVYMYNPLCLLRISTRSNYSSTF